MEIGTSMTEKTKTLFVLSRCCWCPSMLLLAVAPLTLMWTGKTATTTHAFYVLPSSHFVVNSRRNKHDECPSMMFGRGDGVFASSECLRLFSASSETTTEASGEETTITESQNNNNNPALLSLSELFDELILDRIAIADQYLVDEMMSSSSFDGDEMTNHYQNSPYASYIDLQELQADLSSSSTTVTTAPTSTPNSRNNKLLQDLFWKCQKSGGYLIIELEQNQAELVNDMWSIMQHFYDIVGEEELEDNDEDDDGNDDDDKTKELHHQVLERKKKKNHANSEANDVKQCSDTGNNSKDKKTGYRFVQTYMDPNQNFTIQPTTIQDSLKKRFRDIYDNDDNSMAVELSFHLFADISRLVTTLLLAGYCATIMPEQVETEDRYSFDEISEFMNDTLQDNDSRQKTTTKANSTTTCCHYSRSHHRLCQYSNVVRSNGRNILADDVSDYAEALKSHADFALTTLVPFSSIPGLQLWNPSLRKWISPESLHRQRNHATDDSNNFDGKEVVDEEECSSHHSKFVVVLVGKWLELLTNRSIQSCIHRVLISRQPKYKEQETYNSNKFQSSDSFLPRGDDNHYRRRLSAPFFLCPKEAFSIKFNQLKVHSDRKDKLQLPPLKFWSSGSD